MHRHYRSDNTLEWEQVDHGDGTGTLTHYDEAGNVTSVEELTDLPIPEPPELTVEEKLEQLLEALGGE